MSHKPSSPAIGEINDLPRRSFLSRFLAFVVGGFVSLVPAVPAAMFFLDPLLRKKRAVGMTGDRITPDGFIKVASAEQLGATPRYVKVIADLQDFWNKFPDSEVGAVYLTRDEQGTVTCFNARCPHLGCTVKYTDVSQQYVCPCHASAFSLSGEPTNDIPPRNMDSLVCRTDDDGMVWVQFQKFRAGIHEKVPV
jgi:Rieske Fe-S protein